MRIKKFRLLIVAASALIISFGGLAALDNYNQVKETQQKIQQLEVEKERVEAEKQQLKEQSEKTQIKHKKEIKQKSDMEKKLREEIEALKVAKAERERKRLALLDSQSVSAAPQPAQQSFGGSCEDWIAAAGISDTANARELIGRESGCDPYITNPSTGACGVAQELPCGKSGCSLGDGACQIKWMNGYVLGTYKSWAGAVAYHDANGWY